MVYWTFGDFSSERQKFYVVERESIERGGGGGRTGDKGHGGAIVPVDFGQLVPEGGWLRSCGAPQRGTGRSRRRSPAGLVRVWGMLG